jgi:tetrapyrrole methylase family protein / MazG family protein
LSAAEPDVPPEAVAHLEEELGDVLFQVYFHAVLATEEGRFTLADVARTVHDKLVSRHPHVFGDAVAETPQAVAARWEVLKKAEKGRSSVTDGIPAALPALALAAKLQRKGESVGMDQPGVEARVQKLESELVALRDAIGPEGAGRDSSGETLDASSATIEALGSVLFGLADVARLLGVDPESALRARALRFRAEVEAAERG